MIPKVTNNKIFIYCANRKIVLFFSDRKIEVCRKHFIKVCEILLRNRS